MVQEIAVLFDLDGTLVDTGSYWFKGIQQIARDNGYRWTEKDSEETIGSTLAYTVQLLRAKVGIEKTLEEVRKELVSRVDICYQKEGVPWMNGAYQLLEELGTAGIPSAVVSNSPRMLVERVVNLAPEGSLSVMVPGDTPDLPGKPDTQPYLFGAKKLGVEIGKCMIFEDSAAGITAAIRSGAKAVLLGDFIAIEQLATDVQEELANPEKSCLSPGLYEWNIQKILDFLN